MNVLEGQGRLGEPLEDLCKKAFSHTRVSNGWAFWSASGRESTRPPKASHAAYRHLNRLFKPRKAVMAAQARHHCRTTKTEVNKQLRILGLVFCDGLASPSHSAFRVLGSLWHLDALIRASRVGYKSPQAAHRTSEDPRRTPQPMANSANFRSETMTPKL